MVFGKKGQGTSEYLIILAIIIVIALVVVGVMGWFPGLGTGITESQSKAYWSSASPVGITDWKATTTAGQMVLVVQNNTMNQVEVEEITVGGTAIGVTDVNVAGGGKATLTIGTGKACVSGQAYAFDVVISYATDDISGMTQTGAKPLAGTCPA